MSDMKQQLDAILKYERIVKSKSDSRDYRGLELTNGLKCLLISDPQTDFSAASVEVCVGHLMDPVELPGLAHFCEHMLFMGSQKYPEENKFAKFIAEHSGSSNAFTDAERTNFHYDIEPSHFRESLDMFV